MQTFLKYLYIISSIGTLVGLVVSLYQVKLLKKMVRTQFVHDVRLLVNKVDAIKANSDQGTRDHLNLLQGDLERFRDKLIEVFGVTGVEKNGPQ